jgi:hypothetical protein
MKMSNLVVTAAISAALGLSSSRLAGEHVKGLHTSEPVNLKDLKAQAARSLD